MYQTNLQVNNRYIKTYSHHLNALFASRDVCRAIVHANNPMRFDASLGSTHQITPKEDLLCRLDNYGYTMKNTALRSY